MNRALLPRSGVVLALVAALVAGGAGLYSWVALGLGALGFICFAAGALTDGPALVTAGAAGLFGCVVVGGVQDAPTLLVLVGTAATILAWDSARTALTLDEQLGRTTSAGTVTLVHAGATALVGALAVGTGYGIFRVARGGEAAGAFLFLLVAAVVLASALAGRD